MSTRRIVTPRLAAPCGRLFETLAIFLQTSETVIAIPHGDVPQDGERQQRQQSEESETRLSETHDDQRGRQRPDCGPDVPAHLK
jgi:hypothetical protein